MAGDTFSKRFGYSGLQQAEIQIREDAPPFVREALVQIAYDVGLGPSSLREIVCRLLRVRPSPYNWSAPNVSQEVDQLLDAADWYRVYDFVEAVYQDLVGSGRDDLAARWQDEVNGFFQERGVGWQLVEGSLEVREAEGFEASTRGAVEALEESGQKTASSELHEAIRDLSRRPDPDVTGAIQHGMAALECVAREVTGDSRSTLGQIIAKFPDAIPKPLDVAIDKAWGYASEKARHVKEGGAADRDEAVLVVGLVASVSTYLTRKAERNR
jgi:hypothetical protein